MNDQTDKLAAALQKIQPSTPSRKQGMEAAMAAFDTEFARENAQENILQENTVDEKISNSTQGLAAEPRPTGKNTGHSTNQGRVQTLGRDMMTKIRKTFTFTPKSTMMAGSCMAALIASVVVFQAGPTDIFSPVSTEVETVIIADNTPAPPSNITVIERRVVKTPARTMERAVPSVTKMVSRRVRKEDGSFETVTETVVIQEASPELVIIPPVYETVRETIQIAADGSTQVLESETVPASKMADSPRGITSIQGLLEEIKSDEITVTGARATREAAFSASPRSKLGVSAAPKVSPPRFDRTIPAITKTQTRRVVKTPASTMERVTPAITKEMTVRVENADGTFKDVTKTVVIQEASIEYINVPATYETVAVNVMAAPSNMGGNQFENYESNPVTSAIETPVSTFSIDVDTASYSFLRASLNRGQLPPPGAIRLEEMVNYFPYDYEAPSSADEPFKANVSITPTPWNPDTKLMHIGIKGYVPPVNERPSSNIVFLIDTSGSMNRANKLPLLINSFKLLLNTLDEDDTVSIVTYAGRAGTVLEPTPASDKNKIKAALNRLRAGGSTAGAAGLELAYQKAEENFDDEGVNRVILATDGDFNVGFSSPGAMKTFIKKKRDTGIFLSVLGFGNGNYNDHLMQSLAQNGNGVAAYIDTLSEANKVLANAAGSALITIAKDVKIQVEFNPETIAEYRLIGYETRALKREDFNNDKVDAGDIGAGHSVTALYEITPVDSPAKLFDPLRYVARKLGAARSDEFAFVKIRHKLPNSDTSTLQTFPIGPGQERSLKKSTDDMRFAAAVSAVGQKLRGDTQLEDYSYDEAITLASSAKGEDENGYRAEFIQLVRLAKNLQE